MSSDHIYDQPTQRSSYCSDAAVQAAIHSELASGDRSDGRQDPLVSALCSQLDRVLDELWAFADEPSAVASNSVALAQLALRLCSLYPRATPKMNQCIALGEHVIELHEREALLGQACIRMTRREAALLHYLISHRDRIVSREELMHEVWQRRLTGSAARTIDIHVHRLRRKLGKEFASRVETIRSIGYTFSTARKRVDAVPDVTEG